ncbi:MAG: CHAT domain-containing protein [Akkermansiaceae bacterium]|jgi:CHAT domain-containing protein/tetratricopeptide (TPR) repeat protein|nr:CHAT domain-containing protein [Akkermansiaceae bacterium]
MRILSCIAFLLLTAVPGLGQSEAAGNGSALAEEDLEALVKEWRDASPPDDPPHELGAALQALGIIERQLGKPDEALAHLREAVEILAKAPAPERADAIEALALCLQDEGWLEEAESKLLEVLEIRRTQGKPQLLALTLDHLALNHLIQGDYDKVRPLLDEALEIVGKDDVATRARILGHLARYHHTLGSHARALALLGQALALPFEDPSMRLSLRSQAAIAKVRLDRMDEAMDDFASIASDALDAFAGEPLSASPYLNNLGSLALQLGKPEDAALHFSDALGLLESALGPEHPSLMTPLNNLGVAWIESGKIDEAREALERCLHLQERYLSPVHLRVAETRRNLAVVAFLGKDPDYLRRTDEATALGLTLLEDLVRNGNERERLNFINRFDNVSLVCSTADPVRISQLLFASKGRLLDALLGKSDELGTGPEEVVASLEPGSVFIDTCRYQPIGSPGKYTYGAVIYTPRSAPKWVALGDEDELHRWIALLHERLNWQSGRLSGDEEIAPPPMKMAAILKALHRLFWEPIEKELPDGTQHIAWSPDGALHFLPMAALLDDELRPLCHRYLQLATVAHARELIETPAPAKSFYEPWTIVAVSHFPKPSTAPEDGNAFENLLATLRDMPGTLDEMERLHQLAPSGSSTILDADANETTLRSIFPPPAVLHLGCHAFYLAGEDTGSSSIDFDDHSELLQAGGLVLYNGVKNAFGDPPKGRYDDILYPSEIARLSLKGTRLVTLSSCDSGRGTPVSGEGLLGLRRAFHLAGAREVMVALWPVSDAAAPAFMERFYELTLYSGRPSQALWQTQSEMIPRGDSYEFEPAVLRHAPFMISQTGPLSTGEKISPLPDHPVHSWLREQPPSRLVLWLALPLVMIWLLWTLLRRYRQRAA